MTVNRITGFYSGFDTDKMVKDLINAEQVKVDNVKAQKQISAWKQEQYRDIYTSLEGFKEKYFDVLNPTTNLRSTTMFTGFTSSVTAAGEEVSAVEISGNAQTRALEHTITKIEQLATKDKYTSSDTGLNDLTSKTLDFASMPSNFKFSLTIDGVTKTIEFSKADLATEDADGLRDKLNEVIGQKFGTDYNDIVSSDSGKISFEKNGADLTILNYSGSESSLTFLGITSGADNQVDTDSTISSLFGIGTDDLSSLTINGKSFEDLGITASTSMSEMITIINNSSVGITMAYNKASDKITFESDSEGSINQMELSDELKTIFKLDTGVHDEALNAKLTIDGESIIKSSNEFTFDNVVYKLNSTYVDTDPPIELKLSRDTSSIISTLKDFVADYNKIVESLNSKLNEKTYREYKPLTDEEKQSLGEDEVTLWETKAQSGLLRNDSIISSVLSEMRTALYTSVEGVDLSLYDIGIKTTSNYKENGKLEIDEDKLKTALSEDYDSVVALFTSESDKAYLDTTNKSERYSENGLGERILDILNDATRITRNGTGSRGSLIEKAGLPGDTSISSNLLAREMAEYDVKIDDLLDYLANQEDKYYRKFASMESALAEMQNQSSSLLSQLGMSS